MSSHCDQVVVEEDATALERGREWAAVLGAHLMMEHHISPRMAARLLVVGADAGHIRWRVRRAVGPLLVARPRSPAGGILVAVDLDDPGQRLLDLVARLARERAAPVTLIHSIEPVIHAAEWAANFGGSNSEFVPGAADARTSSATARLSELLARYQLRGDVRVGSGPAAELILGVAYELRPDLLALSVARHHGLLHLLRRTVADEVAVGAPGSVLVVPCWPRLHA